MADSPGLGVITLDTALRVRSWSEWLAIHSGVDEQAALGRLLTEFTPSVRASAIAEELIGVLNTGATRVLAAAFHHHLVLCPPPWPNPHFVEMQQHVTMAPLRDAARIVGVIVTIEDVTARLIDEREIARRVAAGDPAPEAVVTRAGANDWRVRQTATRTLKQAATEQEMVQLLQALERDHHDFSVLSGALQVLAASQRDITAPLVGMLANQSVNLRVHAALALGALGDPVAVPALLRALNDDDGNVRFHAIEALGRLAAPDAVAGLQRIAQSGDFFLAFPAIDALAQIDDPAVVPALMGLLEVDDLRPAAIDAIGALGDEDCIEALVGWLGNGRGDVTAIARALVRIARRYDETFAAGASIVDAVRRSLSPAALARLVEAGGDSGADGAVYTVLGWTGTPGLGALVDALRHEAVRSEVSEAILGMGSAALPLLTNELSHGNPATRVPAALLIGAIGDPRGAGALVKALSSHDNELVITAARAVATLADHNAIEGLLTLFGHPDVGVRQAAIAAVNSLDADVSRSRLLPLLTSADPRVRECAVRSVGYFAPDDSAEGLLAALTDEAEEVRRAAIEQLPILDHPRSIPALLEALAEELPRNRAAAAHALRLNDDPRADAALIDALDDEHAWVRYFSAQSLGDRGTRAAADTLEAMARADGAPHVRIAALRALARLDVQALMRVTPAAIDDDDPEVSAAAVGVLSAARGPEAESLLERALQSSSAVVRVAAAETLGHMSTPAAIQMLAWAARIPDCPGLSAAAMDSLRRIGAGDGEHAGTATLALLHLGSERTRRDNVVRLLGTLEPELVAPLCQDVVTQPGLRALAVDALARMRKPVATTHVAAALADPDPTVRRAAVDAFGRLGSATVSDAVATLAAQDPDAAVRRRATAVCRRYGWRNRQIEGRS